MFGTSTVKALVSRGLMYIRNGKKAEKVIPVAAVFQSHLTNPDIQLAEIPLNHFLPYPVVA